MRNLITHPHLVAVLAGLLACLLLGLAGCANRNPHADDAIYLSPAQERDVFVTSNNLGPDTSVIVLANVPKARYENGAIVLTGGKELYVVQPHAWRTYTGTAISTEEAEREIARADRLEAALHDVGEAASDLRVYLDDRSVAAKTESDHLQAQEVVWKQDQEHQVEAMLAEANRLQRSRDQEVSRIVQERDARVARIYTTGSGETQGLTDAMEHAVVEITRRYGDQEAGANVDYRQADERLRASAALETDAAQAKGPEYAQELADYHRKQHDALDAEHAKRLDDIHTHRDDELAALRSETARKIDDVRRLTEAKAERVRQEADRQLAAVQARQANAESAASGAGGDPGPSAAVPGPAEPGSAPSAAPEAATGAAGHAGTTGMPAGGSAHAP